MPARLPTTVKALKGTLRGDRVNAREPRPKIGAPRPSRELALDVRREFDKLVRRLAPLRVLAQVDGLALELCASALAQCWRYEAVLREKGSVYETTTPAGSTMIRQRPEVVLAADAWRRASAMLQQFGLTPASRGRVEELPPGRSARWDGLIGRVDPFEKLLRKRERLDPVAAFQRQRPVAPAPRGPA